MEQGIKLVVMEKYEFQCRKSAKFNSNFCRFLPRIMERRKTELHFLQFFIEPRHVFLKVKAKSSSQMERFFNRCLANTFTSHQQVCCMFSCTKVKFCDGIVTKVPQKLIELVRFLETLQNSIFF